MRNQKNSIQDYPRWCLSDILYELTADDNTEEKDFWK